MRLHRYGPVWAFCGWAFVFAAFPPAGQADDIAVIVAFHGEIDETVFSLNGGKATTRLVSANACAGRIPSQSLKALLSSPGVAFVEEDVILHAMLVPNDPDYAGSQATTFNLIHCPQAWGVSTGNGVRVAVLDTGVRSTHEDIGSGASGKVKIGMNFTNQGASTDFSDGQGHGTHTSGTAGALTNNGVGVAAAGFNCELAMGKVLDSTGSGFTSWIGNGIDWASTTSGAKIISMSFGGGGTSALQSSVDSAWSNGLLLVAAAGNDSTDATSNAFPGAYTNVLSVASVDSTGVLSSFSNFGPWVDVAAPGENILSTYNSSDSSYATLSGTSMATPHVAGVAALVWAHDPAATNSSIFDRIVASSSTMVATPDGPIPLLDAFAAVNSTDTVPTVEVTASPPDAFESTGASGGFLIKRLGTSSASLTVHFTVGGTAVSGTDYTSIGTSIVLAAGVSQVTVNVTPTQKFMTSGSATVILTLASDPSYLIGSSNQATITIHWDDNTVTVAATTPSASEAGPIPGVFTISRAGSTAFDLTVNFTVSGTAVPGTDYAALGTSVVIPAGQASTGIVVSPLDTGKTSGSGTVILTLAAGNYVLGAATQDTVTIQFNDATVTVVATTPGASDRNMTAGVFTISRTGSTSSVLAVNFTVGGTAASGGDYVALVSPVAIPAGMPSATVTVTPVNRGKSGGQATVILSIATGFSYVAGSPSQDTVTITFDNPPPSDSGSKKKCGLMGLEIGVPLLLAAWRRRVSRRRRTA